MPRDNRGVMKLIAVTAGLFAVALAMLLFYLSGKINREDSRFRDSLFNWSQVLATHTTMVMLEDNGLVVKPTYWQGNYIVFFSVLNGRSPNIEEQAAIDKLTLEEYHKQVNARMGEVRQRLLQLDDKKKRMQKISLLCFVLLVTSQLIALYASLRL